MLLAITWSASLHESFTLQRSCVRAWIKCRSLIFETKNSSENNWSLWVCPQRDFSFPQNTSPQRNLEAVDSQVAFFCRPALIPSKPIYLCKNIRYKRKVRSKFNDKKRLARNPSPKAESLNGTMIQLIVTKWNIEVTHKECRNRALEQIKSKLSTQGRPHETKFVHETPLTADHQEGTSRSIRFIDVVNRKKINNKQRNFVLPKSRQNSTEDEEIHSRIEIKRSGSCWCWSRWAGGDTTLVFTSWLPRR